MLSPALATDLFRQPGRFEALTEKISVRHLDFYYGDEIALKDVTVPIYANKVTAIVGPSAPRDPRAQCYMTGRFG